MSIVSFVSVTAGKALLQGKKYSPEILVVSGVVGLVTAGVLAVRATTKLEPVLEHHEEGILGSKDALVSGHNGYDKKEYRKDIVYVYRHTAWDLTKLYGPSITLGAVSVAAILGSYGILKQRNVAYLGLYKASEAAFTKYRERVVEEYGEDKDREYKLGLRAVNEKGEDGKNVKVLKKSNNVNDFSIYAKFFDEFNPNFKKQAEYNMVFLRAQQQYANDLLVSRGYLFLNEVYQSIGLKQTGAGGQVGWVLHNGQDNYVDFGLLDTGKLGSRRFVNGDEDAILLDFNVDGIIYDLIGNDWH